MASMHYIAHYINDTNCEYFLKLSEGFSKFSEYGPKVVIIFQNFLEDFQTFQKISKEDQTNTF